MLSDEEIDAMRVDELRNALKLAVRSERGAREARSAEESKKDKAMQMASSARTHIRSARAIRHLVRHMPGALGANAEPNIDIALIDAVRDLDRAEEIADVIPF